jgi:hypothetical protein
MQSQGKQMEFTQMTTPPEQSPQMRYASLHRAVERGMISSTTWIELTQVCLQLRYFEEARRAVENITDPERRVYFERLLMRHANPQPTASAQPAAAPAGSSALARASSSEPHPIAGAGPQVLRRAPEPFSEEILDSFRFLFLDHMPLTVIVATMTFPVVLGLGGFLTSGSPFLVLPLIALLPGLCVLGLVGAMSRRILLNASRGIDDPPRVPDAKTLAREAGLALRDLGALGSVFFGPTVLLILLGAPFGSVLLSMLLGGFLLPMAMLIRQVTPDWRALSPNVLFPAVPRGGLEYAAAAGVIIGLFAPAAAAAWVTAGSHLYLQVSVIGPLSVAPLFIAARLVGRVLDRNRTALTPLLGEPAPVPQAAPAQPEPAATAQPRPAPQPRAAAPAAQATPRASARATPQHPETAATARQQPKQQRAPQQQRKRSPLRRRATPATDTSAAQPDVVGEPIPDLTKLPGVCTVTGKDRETAGAASGCRPRSQLRFRLRR